MKVGMKVGMKVKMKVEMKVKMKVKMKVSIVTVQCLVLYNSIIIHIYLPSVITIHLDMWSTQSFIIVMPSLYTIVSLCHVIS